MVPKVLWEKGTSQPRKELRSDLASCPFVWAPSYYRGNWDLTYKNKALKIVEIVILYLSILSFFLQANFSVEKFSLKYFLKSRTFTENLFVNFYICHFHFLSFFFSPLVTGSLRGGGGGVRMEMYRIWDSRWKRGREVYGRRKKAREEKVKKSGGNRDLRVWVAGSLYPPPPSPLPVRPLVPPLFSQTWRKCRIQVLRSQETV